MYGLFNYDVLLDFVALFCWGFFGGGVVQITYLWGKVELKPFTVSELELIYDVKACSMIVRN